MRRPVVVVVAVLFLAPAPAGAINKSVDARTAFEVRIKEVFPAEAEYDAWIGAHYQLVRGWFPAAAKWVKSGVPVLTTTDISLDGYRGGNVAPLTAASRHYELKRVL